MTVDCKIEFQQATRKLVQRLFEGDGDGAALVFADILVTRKISVSDSALLRLNAAAQGKRDTQG